MGRQVNRLSARKVESVKAPGMYADGAGLYLQVTTPTAKSWIFRYTLRGRPREMGLGSTNAFGLGDARQRAQAQRQLLADGHDPIEVRERQRQTARLEATKTTTFRECAEGCMAAHSPGWRNSKHRAQWRSTLETYVYPITGDFPVQAVDTALVLKVLRQKVEAFKGYPAGELWTARPDTAGRVRGRIEKILDYATAGALRTGDNPARWQGLLSELLPKKAKVRRVRHHPALPYAELPAFIATLRGQEGMAAKALDFTILTAARTEEMTGAKWPEFNLAEAVWTVPAGRIKGEREHRVPLSPAAVAILRRRLEKRQACDNDYVFPGRKRGRPLSNMAMLELVKQMHVDRELGWRDAHGNRITVHGFRSTFKDWCLERSNFPNEVSEAALAHVIGDKTEAAYARSDMLAKRRQLMAAWSRYCAAPAAKAPEVLSLGRGA